MLPLFAAISAALLATQGRSIFYRGPRVGRGKRVFQLIKFRTLDSEKARLLTRDRVLPSDSGIETPLGGFLRDTRLDELPQLLNVIAGDMNLCGPRPVRPEIAAIYRLEVPNYDDRFEVKPGLVGHTQAYMNHGVSKSVRARYNAILLRAPVRYRYEIAMVALVGLCVLARGWTTTWNTMRRTVSGAVSDPDVNRARAFALTLVPEHGADGGGAVEGAVRVRAASEAALWLDRGVGFSGAAPATPFVARLRIRLPDGKVRSARIVMERLPEGGELAYRYRPASDFAYHVLSRYLLQKVVVPHKSHLLIGRLSAALPSWMTGRAGRRAIGSAAQAT